MNMGETGTPGSSQIGLVPTGVPARQGDRVVSACNAITYRFVSAFLPLVFPEHQSPGEDKGQFSPEDDAGEEINPLAGLEIGQTALLELFNEHLSRQVKCSLQPASPVGHPAADEATETLSLVNETELEESLAVDNLIEKLSQHFSDEIFCLEQRFSHLFPDAGINKDKLPFGPENLCHAFQELLNELGIGLESRLYLFKVLDKSLMKGIDSYYHDLNALLIAEGILPTLKRKLINNTVHARRADVAQVDAAVSSATSVSGEALQKQDDAQVYRAIQQLLNSNGAAGITGSPVSGSPAEAGAVPVFAVTPRLLDSLSEIQQGFSGEAGQVQGSLREQVNAMLSETGGQGDGHGINQIDNETIDVISMIFDLILDDRSLPDFIKALIGRLQIPILKAAIIDRDFFRKKSHPARQLINKLAYAGAGWSEDSEVAKDRLYEKMEEIVLAILSDFEDDLQIFEDLLDDFTGFIESEKKEFEIAQKEVQREAQRKEEVEKHKRRVASHIIEKSRNAQIPDDILEFLVTTWSQVIAEIVVAEDAATLSREVTLQLIDDLIWSLQPRNSTEQRRKMILLLPEMLKVLRQGLDRINYSDDNRNAIFTSLEQYHFAVLKNPIVETAAPEVSDPQLSRPVSSGADVAAEKKVDSEIAQLNSEIDLLPDLDGDSYHLFDEMEHDNNDVDNRFDEMMAEMGLAHETDPGPRIEDEYTELVRGLELGVWVELIGDDDKKIRAKLAWCGDQFTNFSFMNRHYKVIAERPFFVLAEEFRQGRASLVDAPDLFDRAFDGVISGIMKVVG